MHLISLLACCSAGLRSICMYDSLAQGAVLDYWDLVGQLEEAQLTAQVETRSSEALWFATCYYESLWWFLHLVSTLVTELELQLQEVVGTRMVGYGVLRYSRTSRCDVRERHSICVLLGGQILPCSVYRYVLYVSAIHYATQLGSSEALRHVILTMLHQS